MNCSRWMSLAGDARAALETLDVAVMQGFVCVDCIESSSLLDAARALPGYASVRERARARHLAFGRRFGLPRTRVSVLPTAEASSPVKEPPAVQYQRRIDRLRSEGKPS